MKISLFLKPQTMKVCFYLFIALSIVSTPKKADAGVLDLIGSVFGVDLQASAATPDVSEPVKNSQTVTLLESSINPDMKSMKDASSPSLLDDEALSTDQQGTDSDTTSYISSSDKITTYTVKSGDTVASIATKFGISKNTVIYANTNIKNNVLKVGQTLIILPVDGVSYTVKKGDTISSIAKAFRADANDISEYNDITDKNLIAGDKIIVPGGTALKKTETIPSTPKVEKEQPKTEPEKVKTQPERTPSSSNISSGGGITGGYIWPFPAGTGRVSQRLHDDNAYDFAAPKGTPIYAIQDGTVLIADDSGYNGGYGLYVVIDFKDGGQAIFGHMSKVSTYAGESVRKGDVIGYVGSTGRSTGNHVHIGYRGGKANPYKALPINSNGL